MVVDMTDERYMDVSNFVDIDPTMTDDVIDLYAVADALPTEPYMPSDKNEHVDKIDKTIDIAKACLDLGQFAFKKLAPALGSIAGVGTLISAFLALVPEEEDPHWKMMEEKLDALGDKIDKLADKMSGKFDDLKSFLVEFNFFIDIMNPTSKLMKYMEDCMKFPSAQAKKNFQEAYARNTPLDLAYTVLAYMEQNSTNPLKIAMTSDRLKTKNTFNKWFNIIDGVLGQFLFLEAFASGLLNDGDTYNAERLKGRAEKLFVLIEGWKTEYLEVNDDYWPELKKEASEFLDDHKDWSNGAKADYLQKMCNSILTRDAFYITVFSHWQKDWTQFSYYTTSDDRLHLIYGPGNGNTFIYRSRTAWKASDNELSTMRKQVKGTRFDVYGYLTNLKGYPEKLRGQIDGTGFICLVGFLGEETRAANFTRNDGEPGWWTTIDGWYNLRQYYRRIIVGLP